MDRLSGTEPFRSQVNSLIGAKVPIGPWPIHSLELSLLETDIFVADIVCGRYGLPPKGQRSRSHRNVMYQPIHSLERNANCYCWNFRSLELSLPRANRPGELSFSGTFVVVINANCYCFH